MIVEGPGVSIDLLWIWGEPDPRQRARQYVKRMLEDRFDPPDDPVPPQPGESRPLGYWLTLAAVGGYMVLCLVGLSHPSIVLKYVLAIPLWVTPIWICRRARAKAWCERASAAT